MRLLIHDLPAGVVEGMNPADTLTVDANGKAAPCQGCFRCWLKNPGYCFMKDRLQHAGALFGASGEVLIISENLYGGFSQGVKRVLDRSISVSLPFFTYRGGSLHHIRRYRNTVHLTVVLYGDMTQEEKQTAKELVEANRVNGGYETANLIFAADAAEAGRIAV